MPITPIEGRIDWSQLVTKAMKAAAAQAVQLAAAKVDLAARNVRTVAQISRIQDRIDTLGYGIDAGEATEEDEAEQAALLVNLKTWKAYKFALGKVTVQPTWYAAPVWPNEPAVPVIVADPDAQVADLI
ncbi:phage tail protein [Pseudomonas sp. GB2N2]